MALSWYDQLADLLSSAREQTKRGIHEYTPVGAGVKYSNWMASKLPEPEEVSSPWVAGASGFLKELTHQVGEQVEDPLNIALAISPHSRIGRAAMAAASVQPFIEGSSEIGAGVGEGDYPRAAMGMAAVAPALAGFAGSIAPHPVRPPPVETPFKAVERPFELPKSEVLNPVETPFAPPDEPQFKPVYSETKHVRPDNWDDFVKDTKEWADSQEKEYGFHPEEVQEALRQSFKHKINPTMSDTLDSLGDHMDATVPEKSAVEPQEYNSPDVPTLYGREEKARLGRLYGMPDEVHEDGTLVWHYSSGTPKARWQLDPPPVEKGTFAPGTPEREANFKNWFGQSKVVNRETGKPLVVYHGTDVKPTFERFDPAKNQAFGFHFGNPEQAKDRLDNTLDPMRRTWPDDLKPNRIFPVYLKMERPLIIPADIVDGPYSLLAELHNRKYVTTPEYEGLRKGLYEANSTDGQHKVLADFFKSKGYDGIIYKNRYEGTEQAKRSNELWDNPSYVVFDPEQIKSATGNRGTFDPNDPRITRSPTEPEAPVNVTTRGRRNPQPPIPWKVAEQYVNTQPAWKTFTEWYKRVSEVNKKKILGLDKSVLPPTDVVTGQAQSVANTPFLGAHFGPDKYASNWMRKIHSFGGDRSNPSLRFKVESQGHDVNVLPFMSDLVKDLTKYPQWGEYIGQDTQKLGEELLRRMIWTNAHELVHSAGVSHPLVDAGERGVYDFERQNYLKSFTEGPQTESSLQHGDHRMYTVMRGAIDAYKGGELDSLIEEARPHLESWRRLFTEAREISRRSTEAPPFVPPVRPPRPVPPEGRRPGNGGGGIPPGGVPGGGGAGGGGPQPPIGGEPPVTPPSGPPFRPTDVPPKIDFSKLPGHGIKEWINLQRAALTHGRDARFEFKDLAGEGMDWIAKFEDGLKPAGWERVKTLFDKLLAEEQRYGVPIKERSNYMYHLWKESPETVRRTYRRLGIRPSFVNERIYDTYKEGIKAGLTPKYDNPVDIIAERVRQHKKLIADKGLYNLLRAGKLIKPINKAPQDWIPIRNFPFHRYTIGKHEHIQVWAAPPMVAERLNRYLDSPISSPTRDFLQKVAQVSTDVKNVVMSAGIPNTLFNAHGFNTAMRLAAAKGSPLAALGEAAKVPFKLLRSGKAEARFLDENLKDIARFQEAGGTFNLEDHPFRIVEGETVPKQQKGFWESVREARDSRKSTATRNYAALRKIHELIFEDPLFQRALPAWKLKFMQAEEKRLLARGVEPKEATAIAAKNGNHLLGGINWEGDAGLKGDPVFRTALRIAFNAPDWAETNIHIAKGATDWLRNPKDPRFTLYKNLLQNTFLFYVVTNTISKGLSQEDIPTERKFQTRIGHAASGRTRFLKPVGTGADWARLPYEIISKISQGDLSGASDVVKNRLHPLAQGVFNVVLNRNYWGRPLTGKELPVLTQVGRLAHEVTDVAAPSYVKAPVAALAGEAGPEETMMKSIEAPIAYVGAGPDSVSNPYGRGRRLSRRFQRTRNSR